MKITMSILIFTVIMGWSSNSWLFLWLMLELNSPMFSMSMIFQNENPMNPMIYFIIQAISSMLMISSITLMLMKNYSFFSNLNVNSTLYLISYMKMGMIPFQNWMLKIMKTMKKNSLITLMTIQKILPLKIMSMLLLNNSILMILILNLLFSPLIILMSNKIHFILLSSSIYNMTWISSNINYSSIVSMTYFLIYSILTLSMIKLMFKQNMKNTNVNQNKMNFNLIILILTLSGIPPLWGFTIKMLMIKSMSNQTSPKILILILLLSSIPMLMGYFKFIYNPLMMNFKKSTSMKKINPYLIILNVPSPLILMTI